MGRYSSGQRGQTVNLLSYDFGGSNPSLPTFFIYDFRFMISHIINLKIIDERGSSSVGRATAFQAVGRGFEPRLPLSKVNRSFRRVNKVCRVETKVVSGSSFKLL